MHIRMKQLFATAALSLLVSLVPVERSWAVPTLELGESGTDETLTRGFFEGRDLKVTSHGTDPLPGFKMSVDYLAGDDTVTEVAFLNGEFVAGGDSVPQEGRDRIFFKKSARRTVLTHTLSHKLSPPHTAHTATVP